MDWHCSALGRLQRMLVLWVTDESCVQKRFLGSNKFYNTDSKHGLHRLSSFLLKDFHKCIMCILQHSSPRWIYLPATFPKSSSQESYHTLFFSLRKLTERKLYGRSPPWTDNTAQGVSLCMGIHLQDRQTDNTAQPPWASWLFLPVSKLTFWKCLFWVHKH